MGHVIEDKVRGVKEAAHEFLYHRVGIESARPMSELTGEPKYGEKEMGRPDKWRDVFGDNAGYVGKRYPSRPDKLQSTEVISMGLEQMHRDPVKFARRDPEYFRFICGILDGSLRGSAIGTGELLKKASQT